MIDFLLHRFSANAEATALVWKDRDYRYGQLLEWMHEQQRTLEAGGITRGSVVSLEADYSPSCIALLLALIRTGCIVVPLTPQIGPQREAFRDIAEVEWILRPMPDGGFESVKTGLIAGHPLIVRLRTEVDAGLILFSSGSTGTNKAAIHSWRRLLGKFRTPRKCFRTLAVLLFDHIGGIDTLCYSLSNASCLVIPESRAVEHVCQAVQRHRVEVLPVSPSFLNLLVLSRAHESYDLKSIKYVTYGAEVMPEWTLKECRKIFPEAVMLQKYGTTETGALRSQSKSSDSLWVRIGGEGYQTRIVDGLLEIKAESAMLGYLNAPSPFTEDGWFRTGDMVETDGDFMRILGRQSDLINVGGEKVNPQEVENVLLSLENVSDATVKGEPHPILGQIVVASMALHRPEDMRHLRKRVQQHCRGRLANYKIPVKIRLAAGTEISSRFKKIRRLA